MKKSDEMRKEIDALSAKISDLKNKEEFAEAAKWAGELNVLVDEYKAAKALEAEDIATVAKGTPAPTSNLPENELARRAFNKLVLHGGEGLTDEEKAAYKNVTNTSGNPGTPGQIEAVSSRGGYLVPTEQWMQIQDKRNEFTQLRDYITVRQTPYTSGKWPTISDQNLVFTAFDELTDIAEDDVAFGQANYTVEDKGLIIPVSNQIIDDASADIVDICGRELALAAVRSENAAVLGHLGTLAGTNGANATTISTHKALNEALFKNLPRKFYNNAKIYTNQSGFLFLANLDDGNNRPLLVPDVTAPDKYMYRGKEIVIVEDSLLENWSVTASSTTTEYAPFYIGNLAAYVWMFEKQGLELSISTEYLWRKYGTALRGVIRFGTVVYDSTAMVARKVALS
ncbi:phage major capsid protein [Selenomonas sp. AB3002]|uniref:phage major capsid protein n=1 Tax=Selenomonas sp. AB3002 TaxID=1392502 RepID=UPI0004960A59